MINLIQYGYLIIFNKAIIDESTFLNYIKILIHFELYLL